MYRFAKKLKFHNRFIRYMIKQPMTARKLDLQIRTRSAYVKC